MKTVILQLPDIRTEHMNTVTSAKNFGGKQKIFGGSATNVSDRQEILAAVTAFRTDNEFGFPALVPTADGFQDGNDGGNGRGNGSNGI